MIKSIATQLGPALVKRLIAVFFAVLFFSCLWFFSFSFVRRLQIESVLARALNYALQEPVRNSDLIGITRAINSFKTVSPQAAICVSTEDTIFSLDEDCKGHMAAVFQIPFSSKKLLIAVKSAPPMDWWTLLLTGGALFTVLSFLLLKIHKVAAVIVRDVKLLGVSKGPCLFTFEETTKAHEKILSVQHLLIEREQMMGRARLGQIAQQVAHDIRSPLTSIQTGVRLLGAGAERTATADALNLLHLGSRRLEQIANDLLTRKHQEGEAAAGAAVGTAFSLHEVCDELLGEFQAQPLGRAVQMVKHYQAAALYVHGDRTRLQRALGNLVKNALEAMQTVSPECAKTLTVTAARDGGQVRLQIMDTGPGMAPETVAKVLRGGHTEGKADGHGIGMQVVREVIEQHHGQLICESTRGKGTTFTVTLPPHDTEGPMVTVPIVAGHAVVVIDDDAGMRAAWATVLAEEAVAVETYDSWETFTARDGMAPAPSTVIIDYHFDNSEVDGLTIGQRLRAQGVPHLLLCTAEYWKPSVKQRAQELGLTLCPKPLPRIVVEKRPNAPLRDHSEPTVVASVGTQAQVTNGHEGYRVLLIDDDPDIAFTWKCMRQELGIGELVCVRNVEALAATPHDLTQFDITFVDKNIHGSTYDGAATVAYLRAHGARRIVLASGENPADLQADPQWASVDGISPAKVPRDLAVFMT